MPLSCGQAPARRRKSSRAFLPATSAEAAVKNKELDRALELYTQAVEQQPTAEVLAARAALQNRVDRRMEALADASQALELDPNNVVAHQQKGHAYFNLGEIESAKEAFEAAAALEPGKRIHKQWVEMCKAQLGEELEPPPMRPISPPRERSVASTSATSAGSEAGPLTPAGSEGAGGQTLRLQGEELRRFLADQQLAAKAQEAKKAREAAEEAETSTQPKHVTVDDPEFSKYWGTSVSPAIIATLPDKPTGKFRHQWFQNPDKVEVAVLAKGLGKDQVSVSMEPRRLAVSISSPEGEQEYNLDLLLHGEVVPEESRFSVLSTKVEVRLKKAKPGEQWPALEEGAAGAAAAAAAAHTPAAPSADAKPSGPPAYPYAGKKVDWDKLESQLRKEEKEEKLEGDAGLNKFFKDLYQQGDEDMRRAMMKSMQESGGTALSTNWKEVEKKTYKPGGKDDDGDD